MILGVILVKLRASAVPPVDVDLHISPAHSAMGAIGTEERLLPGVRHVVSGEVSSKLTGLVTQGADEHAALGAEEVTGIDRHGRWEEVARNAWQSARGEGRTLLVG